MNVSSIIYIINITCVGHLLTCRNVNGSVMCSNKGYSVAANDISTLTNEITVIAVCLNLAYNTRLSHIIKKEYLA